MPRAVQFGHHQPISRPPLPEDFGHRLLAAAKRWGDKLNVPDFVAKPIWKAGFLAGWAAAHRHHGT